MDWDIKMFGEISFFPTHRLIQAELPRFLSNSIGPFYQSENYEMSHGLYVNDIEKPSTQQTRRQDLENKEISSCKTKRTSNLLDQTY